MKEKEDENRWRVLAGAVALLTFIVYLVSLRNGFVNWDDQVYVFENPNIRSLNWIFFKWAFLGFHEGNWHPLTWISHALDYAVWGLNPMGHHLTNNILHAINTFMVVVLVARLVEAAKPLAINDSPFTFHLSPFTLIAAATTGLLFGLHPIHVESVAWVSERKDLLCALFFLLSIMSYVAHRAERIGQSVGSTGSTPYAMRYALCFFVLALLSKPMAVSLPVVLLILDWYPFRRIQSLKSCLPACIEKIPFFALGLVSSLLAILAQKTEGALEVIAPPLSVRLAVAAKSLIAYLYKMAVPFHLTPVYPYPSDVSIISLPYFLSAAAVIGITMICVAAAGRRRVWLSAWGYYLITLLPVIGLVQVGSQAMAERYAYLPSIGPFLLAGLGAAQVSAKIGPVKKWEALSRLVPVSLAFFVFVSLSYLTFRQIGIWENGITLWGHVIENEPKEAIKAYINRGTLFQEAGQLDRAMADFDKAIALDPVSMGIYMNPAIKYEAYLRRGQVFEKEGDLHRALADFDTVSELNPSYAAAYVNRAGLFERSGQIDKAITELDKAVAVNPNDDAIYIERGILYGKYLSIYKAIDQFSLVINKSPNYASAFGNRGWAYSLIGLNEQGLADMNKAIELDPSYANAFFYRGNLYLRAGKQESAVSDFKKACDLGAKVGCSALKSLGGENHLGQ